MDSLCLIFFYL
uniref:Uncharacterized protein n=1 Tax=Arundo donax TaxID=35708 RepID=A0A0A9FKJ3_ARUDO